MKILYLTGISPHHKTGIYNAVIDRIKEIDKLKIDYSLYSIIEVDSFLIRTLKLMLGKEKSYSVESDAIINDNEISYQIVRIQKSIFSKIFEWISPKYYFKKIIHKLNLSIQEFDLIHCHWVYPHGYIGMMISQKYNIPYVISAHGSDVHTIPFKSKFKNNRSRIVLKNSSANFFVSKKLQQIAEKKLSSPQARSNISYNGVTVPKIEQVTNNGYLKIGYVGNLNYTKGADLLPDIFIGLHSKISDNVTFTIAGDGIYFSSLREQFDKLSKLKVNMLGKISREAALSLMQELDLLIIPSRNEGFGIVAIEALLSGTKVAASTAGGLSEILEDYDMTFNLDETDLSNFIEFCFQKLYSEGISENIVNQCSKKYSITRIVEKEIEVYRKVLY